MNATHPASDPARRERGQVLVILVIGMVAMLAMVGLIVDGGNAFSHQRMTQNATDAAANGGAVVIARNLITGTETDAAVLAGIQTGLTANGASFVAATYTDIGGTPIGVTVGAAPGGTIPVAAAGVEVTGRQTFPTYIAGIVGMSHFDATTKATAVAGTLTEACPADAGCGVWPVTVPVTTVTCDGTGDPVLGASAWPTDGTIVEVPLCKAGPGNVGWLDWYPPAGGASELADTILHPNNPAIKIADWYFVAETGNVNSIQVEDALRTYQDELVVLPLFADTCNNDPGDDASGNPLACTGGRGHGQNLYYLLQAYAGFRLCGPLTPGCSSGAFGDVSEGAYVTGHPTQCSSPSGATSCLFGRFENIFYSGTVSASPGNTGGPLTVGVQLIR